MVKFVLGSMKSGKSTMLQSYIEKYIYAKQKVLFLYPKKSFRGYQSRNGDKILKNTTQLGISGNEDRVFDTAESYDAVFVDEAHLLPSGLLEQIILAAVEKGIPCYIAALNSDYLGKMWPAVVDNFHYATDIEYLTGVCESCGSFLGNHSYLTEENSTGSNIIIGDKKYRCICNRCWRKLS